MRCKKSDGSYVTATMKVYYADCTNRNLMCNSSSNAYVPAITVCQQSLF